jgi:F0F1-type ATP synthase assembly protein I
MKLKPRTLKFPRGGAGPAAAHLMLVRRMDPASETRKLLRAVLLPVIVVTAYEGYQIAHAASGQRRGQIVFLIVSLAAVMLIVVLSARKRALSPEHPRLSQFTLAGIALVVIIIAVLTHYL